MSATNDLKVDLRRTVADLRRLVYEIRQDVRVARTDARKHWKAFRRRPRPASKPGRP